MIEALVNNLHLRELADWRAVLEIVVLSYLIYRLLLLIKGTRAVQMLYGLIGLVFVFWITGPGMLGLETIHQVLIGLSFYIPIAIIVVFQNTIRRALTGFGVNPFGRLLASTSPAETRLDLVVSAAYALAAKRIGGLIVMEREQGLRNWTESGISLDAIISYDLIVNVFSPYTPLHDGALVIGDNRVKAASCFLPLTGNPALSTQYGTRHRAGIGITEETDAVSIIISEERGVVSLAIDGVIHDSLDKSELRQILRRAMEVPARRKGPELAAATAKEADAQDEPAKVEPGAPATSAHAVPGGEGGS